MWFFNTNALSLLDSFLETIMGNILLDYDVIDFNIILSVAREIVQAFEGGKEWCQEHEKDVGQNRWGPLLINKMSDELCQPAENVDRYHNILEVAAKSLFIEIHMQESLHDNDANDSHCWTHKPNEEVAHEPDYGKDEPQSL